VRNLDYVENFQELEVYQRTRNLSEAIFELTKDFPDEEKYSLIDQIRRSSRSIGAQIAEAWGKRSYRNHFISKITDADAEQLETQHWLNVAADAGYLTEQQFNSLLDKCRVIGKMLQSIINKADKFCSTEEQN
jgi:four helix bundle protein